MDGSCHIDLTYAIMQGRTESQNNMVPIFDTLSEQKLAYLLMRKCGCTSILGGFEKLRDSEFAPNEIDNIHASRETQIFARKIADRSDWYRFTIVRDPIRRFLSFYSDKILNKSLALNRLVLNPQVFGYRSNMSFDEAIEVATSEAWTPDSHVVSQSEIIDSIGFDLNFIGRFESFDQSIAKIASDTGVQIPAYHLNRTSSPPLRINADQFRRLASYYSEDFSRFGYPADYQGWCKLNYSEGSGTFQQEQGLAFENEATLLSNKISRQSDHFSIELSWHVHPGHSRSRHVRVLEYSEECHRIHLTMPKVDSLSSITNDESHVTETLKLMYSDIPPTDELDSFWISVFFWSREKKRARVTNFNDTHHVMLPLFTHYPDTAMNNYTVEQSYDRSKMQCPRAATPTR